MRNGEKIVVIVLVVLIIIILIWPVIIAGMWNASLGRPSTFSITADRFIDSFHSKEYDEIIREYAKKRFGEVLFSKMTVSAGEWTDFDEQSYRVKLDIIMDNNFSIYINKETKMCSDTFLAVLSTDPKFQHLYSEWVKKKVGIEDENVELGFTGNYDTPYIDFKNITTLSDDYGEIFENTHNLYLSKIECISSFDMKKDYIETFYEIKNNNYYKIAELLGKPEKSSLFVYFNDYRIIYNFPEEEIASIRKNNIKIEIPNVEKSGE